MKSVKNLALAAIVMILAVGAAFATTSFDNSSFAFPAGAGYSANENNTLVPEEERVPLEIQSQLCVFRQNCAGGDFPCKTLISGTDYSLFSPSTTCHIQLGQVAP
jgi:hypothetical protein